MLTRRRAKRSSEWVIAIAAVWLLHAPGAHRAQAAEQNHAPQPAEEAYQIGAGDLLSITVWKEPDASAPAVAVRPDGKITMPLIKDVAAAGLTPAELEKRIAAQMQPFVQGAEVTVLVQEVRSKKIYLVGAVRKQGALPLSSPLTVLQAIAEAGGLTEFAKKKKIYVLRFVQNRQVRLPFNYEAAIKGLSAQETIVLQPADTIVVP